MTDDANQEFHVVHSDKGGTGKTTFASAVTEKLYPSPLVLLLDADPRNPSFDRRLGKRYTVKRVALDTQDGVIEAMNELAREKGAPAVLDLPAGAGAHIAEHGSLLARSLGRLERQVRIWWVINRTAEPLQSLVSSLPALLALKPVSLTIVKNGFFGTEGDFSLYADSRVGKVIEGRPDHSSPVVPSLVALAEARDNGLAMGSTYLPNLNDLAAQAIFEGGQGVEPALKGSDSKLSFGQRMAVEDWWGQVGTMIDGLRARGLA